MKFTHLLVLITSISLMTACSPAPESNPAYTPIKVEIVKTDDGGYTLLRGGEPYVAKGAGITIGDIERFAAHGGNSVRTWSTYPDHGGVLEAMDAAHANGISVALGLPMRNERHGFDYDDEEAVAAQLEMIREEVLKYRDHPAVLVWVIGNELNHFYTNPRVWNAVNDVAAMIRELDPNHPTTTTTAGFKPDVNKEILARAPALDFISFQMYYTIFEFREQLKETGFDKPFMVTEWGAVGWWESDKTDWGTPYETTSSEKADVFLRAWNEVLVPLENQLIGSYVFFWGQKQERTPTWFGMLTEDGNKTEAVDVMQYAWTGEWPDNRTPRVNALSVNGINGQNSVQLTTGQEVDVVFDVVDPEGAAVTYRWELKPESTATSHGGDYEEPISNLDGFIADAAASTTTLTAPPAGKYRLFAYAEDEQQHVAHANMPLLVVD